ncbi:hypothetical protein [Thioclava sp.]|uniref:hypothetical protein n=1 Tax=Thioclava sp. TaxID=1933450 RepID=UPI003242D49D
MERIESTFEKLKELPVPEDLLGRCELISKKLSSLGDGQGAFLTLDFFAVDEADDIELVRAANLLCSLPESPLHAGGYIVGDDDFIFLDAEDFSEVLRSGDLVHPETGDLIEGGANQVHLYYFLASDGGQDQE